MQLQKIDHIGVAVPDLEAAIAAYTQLFGVGPSHREVVESDGVETVMCDVGESRIELLGATGPDSKITGFLAKRGGGIHHVAYGVEDVQASLEDLASMGMRLLDARPGLLPIRRDRVGRRGRSIGKTTVNRRFRSCTSTSEAA